MQSQRRAPSAPDLFGSSPTIAGALERPTVPGGGVEPDDIVSRPRHLLPKNLAEALEWLNDAEVDALLAAVNSEARRRGRLAPTSQRGEPTVDATSRPRKVVASGAEPSMSTGKLNAVRAAFKAGVKASAIARQFGISQSDVKKALAAEKFNR